MKCARCQFEEKLWPVQGWTVPWQQGRFWFCSTCLNHLLAWWLALTLTLGEEDPSRR